MRREAPRSIPSSSEIAGTHRSVPQILERFQIRRRTRVAAPRSGRCRRRAGCRCAAVRRARPRGRRFPAARGPRGSAPPIAVVADLEAQRAVVDGGGHLARVACECLTTLVSASATMKYALASISGGSRALVTSASTGRSSRETTASTPARRPPCVSTDGRIPWASSRSSALLCSACVERLGEQRLRPRGVLAQRPLRELERDDRVDQALLGAVVEVAHDAPARLVARGEHAGAGGRELIAAVGVGDRGAEQLREMGEAFLRVGGRHVRALPSSR